MRGPQNIFPSKQRINLLALSKVSQTNNPLLLELESNDETPEMPCGHWRLLCDPDGEKTALAPEVPECSFLVVMSSRILPQAFKAKYISAPQSGLM